MPTYDSLCDDVDKYAQEREASLRAELQKAFDNNYNRHAETVAHNGIYSHLYPSGLPPEDSEENLKNWYVGYRERISALVNEYITYLKTPDALRPTYKPTGFDSIMLDEEISKRANKLEGILTLQRALYSQPKEARQTDTSMVAETAASPLNRTLSESSLAANAGIIARSKRTPEISASVPLNPGTQKMANILPPPPYPKISRCKPHEQQAAIDRAKILCQKSEIAQFIEPRKGSWFHQAWAWLRGYGSTAEKIVRNITTPRPAPLPETTATPSTSHSERIPPGFSH